MMRPKRSDAPRGAASPKRNPLTGKLFRIADEFRIHVDAGGAERIVPDTAEWRPRSIPVRITAIWHDGIDEMVTGRRIWVTDEGNSGPRPVCLPPPSQEWCLAEGSIEYAPLWSRRRDWELLPA